jgi:hypothetical protein
MTGPLAGRSHDYFAFNWAPDSRHILTTTSADSVPYLTLWSVPLDGDDSLMSGWSHRTPSPDTSNCDC